MESKKEKWLRPQLIVLGRGTPEESVLQVCKTLTDIGPATTQTVCKKRLGQNCKRECSVISATS